MTGRGWSSLAVVFVLTAGGCFFSPDLERFPPCSEAGTCAPGATCVLPERRCVPDCLDCPTGDDAGSEDAGEDGGGDSGEVLDAGGDEDAGHDAGEEDAGTEPVDAGSLTFETAALEPAVEGVTFEIVLVIDGGVPPYEFSSPDASVPEGMTLTDAGALQGAPLAPGTYVLHPQVRDSSTPPLTASVFLPWEVRPLLRVAGPGLLVRAANNQPYAEVVSAHGGVPPYTFRKVLGGFAGTIALSTDGGVSGTAAGSITTEVAVEVQDSAEPPQTVVRVLSFESAASPGFTTVMSRSVPDGRVGTPYMYLLRARTGTPPFVWTHSSGALPNGITLDTDTGLLSGTPLESGVFPFSVSVRDQLFITDGQDLELTVY